MFILFRSLPCGMYFPWDMPQLSCRIPMDFFHDLSSVGAVYDRAYFLDSRRERGHRPRLQFNYDAFWMAAVMFSRKGNVTVNVAPWPSPSLLASIMPPWSSTRCRAMERPRPRPLAVRLTMVSACRKRSNTKGRKLGLIPFPVSLTV